MRKLICLLGRQGLITWEGEWVREHMGWGAREGSSGYCKIESFSDRGRGIMMHSNTQMPRIVITGRQTAYSVTCCTMTLELLMNSLHVVRTSWG